MLGRKRTFVLGAYSPIANGRADRDVVAFEERRAEIEPQMTICTGYERFHRILIIGAFLRW